MSSKTAAMSFIRHTFLSRSKLPSFLNLLRIRASPESSPTFLAPDRDHRQQRWYTSPVNSPSQEPHQTTAKPATPISTVPKPKPVQPHTRHEVQEGTQALNLPYNPPGGPVPGGGPSFSFTKSPLFDAILTTFLGLGAVFVGGVIYVRWYKSNVLNKLEAAFSPGYDPALELARWHTARMKEDDESTQILRREEQDSVDRIIHGEEPGHYFMLLGPKGSGKGTMIFDAMNTCDADGVSLCEAHPDLEVFRLRLGKALNFEFNEDTQTGLFQRRDPREGGPALDIERAMNKLEKVALRLSTVRGKPLVLVINNVHFFHNNEEGRNLILQLQQKAEAWSASGILTMVFSSDDFWPFYVMRKSASRMHVLSISDLSQQESMHAFTRMRKSVARLSHAPADEAQINESVSIIGGRLAYLSKIAKSADMVGMAKHLLEVEKAWLLSQIGLIPDCDDDVMDEQKWSSCSWLLLREFVKLREEQKAVLEISSVDGHVQDDLPLPAIPYWRCRQIMTRADFLEELDRLNIISIDIQHNVRPDSNLILYAAQEVVKEGSFDELLENVRDRIDEIESLHRTRELTFKDLDKGDVIKLSVDKRGAELSGVRRSDQDDE